MSGCLKFLVAAALAAAVCAGPAQAAGQLDRGFGDQGRAQLGLELGSGGEAALAPDGSLYVATSEYLAHVLPDGSPDLGFGNAGRVAIEAPPRFEFRLADLAVDGSGRPLVFGVAIGPPVEDPRLVLYPPEPTTSAMARRYLGSGAPDPSFASDGLLLADFGVTSYFPTYSNYPTGWLPTAAIAAASLDQRERIVLAVTMTRNGRGTPPLLRSVVRLGRNGSLDPSFGKDGVAAVSGETAVAGMALDRRGAIVLAGSPPFSSDLVVNRFLPGGRPDPALGPGGMRVYRRGGPASAMAANRSGGIAVLGEDEEGVQTIFRLHADGDPVRGFGFGGLRRLVAKQGERSQLLLDRRGRVLTLALRQDGGPGEQVVERLRSSGGADRGFGRGGALRTSFAPSIYEQPWALLFSGAKLLTVASGRALPEDAAGQELLLARYRLK